LKSNNHALIINYAPILTLDIIGLFMRGSYAWQNRYRDERVLESEPVVNPIYGIEQL